MPASARQLDLSRLTQSGAMLISVGILAFNEELRIGRTIRSLLAQSVFVDPEAVTRFEWEIVVVPNGCTDKTHEVAESVLKEGLPCLPREKVGARVQSLAQAGKSRAWNELIHAISHPE